MNTVLRRPFSASARIYMRPGPSLSQAPLPQDTKPAEEALQEVAEDQKADKLLYEAFKGSMRKNYATPFIKFAPNDFLRPSDLMRESRTPAWSKLKRAHVGKSKAAAQQYDLFRQFDMDPMAFALNHRVLSHYVSPMGLIKNRRDTDLTIRSQRRVAKAIKRARMMGIMPLLYKQGLVYREGN